MTASCDRWRPPIADAAAGEAVPSALEAHLGGCAACRQALSDEQALHSRIAAELGQALDLTPSSHLLPLVREQISRDRVRWWPLLLPAAAVLALFVFAVDPWRRPAVSSRGAASVEGSLPSVAPRLAPAAAVARRSAARAPLRRDPPEALEAAIGPIPEAEPVRPTALVIAPLDALPPIEPKPLVTVGLDFEGVDR